MSQPDNMMDLSGVTPEEKDNEDIDGLEDHRVPALVPVSWCLNPTDSLVGASTLVTTAQADTPVPTAQADTLVPTAQSDAPVPTVQGDAPVPTVQGHVPVPTAQGDAPVPTAQGDTPVPILQDDTPVPMLQGDMPVPMAQGDMSIILGTMLSSPMSGRVLSEIEYFWSPMKDTKEDGWTDNKQFGESQLKMYGLYEPKEESMQCVDMEKDKLLEVNLSDEQQRVIDLATQGEYSPQ